ncbi:hypothetical protein DL770_010995 [Monosporascus sp. CRB-9-2]|nr:hypothetical protein DL770_010995 [Monosporascus sp. CRB-9-2]
MLSAYGDRLAAEEEKRRRTADGPGGVDAESTWVKEMGWAKHLEGVDLVELYEAGAGPISSATREKLRDAAAKEEQRRLARLGESFDREMARCVKRLDAVPHETLRWLASIDPNKPAGRPFGTKDHASSMDRYRTYWKRYLCYCVRARRLGRDAAEARHRVRFSDAQWAALGGMARLLDGDDGDDGDDGERGRGTDGEGPGGGGGAPGRTEALDRSVFQFCICSLKQKVAFRVYNNPLLHFAAVLGIDGAGAAPSWRPARNYTGQLAGIMWCGRLLMLEHVFEGQPDDPEDMGVEIVERFKHEYRQWLADGSNTPFSTIIRWMSYGKGHRRKEGGTARIMWEEGGEALRYLGQRIELREFRGAARAGVREAEDLLDGLFFGGWADARASIETARLVDSMVYEGPGRSFATNGRNEWLRPGYQRVAELARGALWDGRAGRWRQARVAGFLSRLRDFKKALLINTHVWGGQPGRGPEIMTVRHCDTQQLLRNVFVFDGQVLLVTDRDKSKAIRGIGRKVARFLPEHVGKMMVAYVAWLLPFEGMLAARGPAAAPAAAPPPPLDGWLWGDGRKGRWETAELSKQLASATGRHLGVELTVADYRHVAIELGRKIRGLVMRQLEVEIGADDGDGDGDGGQAGDGECGYGDPATGEARPRRKMEYIWDLQATHGSAIAQQHYALDIRFPGQLQPQMIANYREISRLWHQYLGLDDENAGGGGGEEGGGVDIEAGLRRLLGEGARWRSGEQRDAMAKVMALQGGQVLIVVLPTGGGKSILFILPPAVEKLGTTVVVVPFVALMDDLVERAAAFGVDCLRWQPAARTRRDEPLREARLVVVSADLASSDEFTAYADGLRARGLLQRIFVDECHTIIMDAGYRTALAGLRGLYRFDRPVILLTATLPVRLERWFRREMVAGDAGIVRAATVKQNIRYRVTTVSPGSTAVADEVVRTVSRLEKGMGGGQKGVVYCRTKKTCEALAERLGCDFYHSGITDEGRRRQVLRRWAGGGEGEGEREGGASRWITATTGLGTGVDIEGIVAVVHAEQPYGLVDFVQQTGRGGRRDGEVVESVIVTDGRAAWYDRQAGDVEQQNRQAMEWFVAAVDCRRVGLGAFMDGQGRDCEEVGGERCDRCRRGRTGTGSPGPAPQPQPQPQPGQRPAPENRLKQQRKEEHPVAGGAGYRRHGV